MRAVAGLPVVVRLQPAHPLLERYLPDKQLLPLLVALAVLPLLDAVADAAAWAERLAWVARAAVLTGSSW